jgi:hypothetical protein
VSNTFIKNLYDEDGDKFNDCILIFTDKNGALNFNSLIEFKVFIKGLQDCFNEIWIEQSTEDERNNFKKVAKAMGLVD